MTTNEKQNKQPEAGKKELTPRQIQMRKKMVVFPLFFLAFAGCMWLIFSPTAVHAELLALPPGM